MKPYKTVQETHLSGLFQVIYDNDRGEVLVSKERFKHVMNVLKQNKFVDNDLEHFAKLLHIALFGA